MLCVELCEVSAADFDGELVRVLGPDPEERGGIDPLLDEGRVTSPS